MTTLIEVHDLHFTHGHHEVLRGIDLTVESGEVLALLGPNGVGKTTLIECLLGTLPPASGTVRVLGTTPRRADGAGYHPLVCVTMLAVWLIGGFCLARALLRRSLRRSSLGALMRSRTRYATAAGI